jgi:hypothetical protein
MCLSGMSVCAVYVIRGAFGKCSKYSLFDFDAVPTYK